MLWQRLVTALALLPLVLGAMFYLPNDYFAAVIAIPVLLAGREWANLAPVCRTTFPLLLGGTMASFFAIEKLSVGSGIVLLYASALFWIFGLYAVMRYPNVTAWAKNRALMYLVGLVLLVPAWYAVVKLQGMSSPEHPFRGPLMLLGGFVIVWGADVGAYFAGRAFGKHKLAPLVSPGKSIEGAVGGILLTMAIGVGVGVYFGLPASGMAQLLALVLVSTFASILGDLFESLAKREAGVKDSGTLLPGHGGMLDRIDSITCAVPVFALGLQFVTLN